MYLNKQNCHEKNQFLSLEKEEFVKVYTNIYHGKAKAEEIYLEVLSELDNTLLAGNIESFKKFADLMNYITSVENQLVLKAYYDNVDNPIKHTNLVILACKYNQVEALDYMFDNSSKILNNLSISIGRAFISPEDKDSTCNNVFYYAIRTSNVKLLDTIINKCPTEYVADADKLEEILSKAYAELNLKNVLLSNEMTIFVERSLINLRFFSNNDVVGSFKTSLRNIKERIGLVIDNIGLINFNLQVDDIWLFRAKFVAHNIHILKHQLKSTYDRLPWEEIEFCLIIFISSNLKLEEINIFYDTILDKGKLLKYLIFFSKNLAKVKDYIESMDISKLAIASKLKREDVVAVIIGNSPEFEELYHDYQQIRDIHSLEKISNSIKVAVSANLNQKDERLSILRSLQVIGEYLKNTLDSPKLSNSIGDLLLSSLSRNTREVIKDLRNSLSHANSLDKRIEIEKNADVNFFYSVQNDINKINDVISNIRYNNKIKIVRILLKKIVDSENLDDIKRVTKSLSNVNIGKVSFENVRVMEFENLEKLIRKLGISVVERTSDEEQLFGKLNEILCFEKTKLENIKTNYFRGLSLLKLFNYDPKETLIHNSTIEQIKKSTNILLENITPKMEPYKLKEIANLSIKIIHSVRSRNRDNIDEIERLISEIFYSVEFGIGTIKWIEELRERLEVKEKTGRNKKKTKIASPDEYNKQLALKLTQLTAILNNNGLIENISSFKSNKTMRASVEMLVLDIMSILGDSKKCLDHNLHFLDENSASLRGKCLRNHLAHDNALMEVLLSDPAIALILNAKILTAENLTDRKIGRLVIDDPAALKGKFDQDLVTINNQKIMFDSLEIGDVDRFKNCLKAGADIKARNLNLWTSLHFAAKGSSYEVIKFILDQNLIISKDINGRTPLHIAAAHGRNKCIIELLINADLGNINDVDNRGQTPLHTAASNGHADTVKVLLQNKANTKNVDDSLSVLDCAIRNNHIDAVKVLLEPCADLNSTQNYGGFTSMHQAAAADNVELINLLLANQADVKVKNDWDLTPLYAAARKGHLRVVEVFVLSGAEVNARNLEGYTPLHAAVEGGHEDTVDFLLKHGASVDVAHKIFNNTALHFAAQRENVRIARNLLEHGADPNGANSDGVTALVFAACANRLEIVIALLDYGVDINAKTKNKITALHCASYFGHKNIVTHLINHKADVDFQTDVNVTPLHIAAISGKKEIVEILLQNKAQVDFRSHGDMTPLHAAVRSSHIDIVEILLEYQADVNAKSHLGMSPLHIAAMNGNEEIANLLLENNSDVTAKGKDDLTPMHLAAANGHNRIVDLLIKNKAEINAKTVKGLTPLDFAARYGHKDVVQLLLKNNDNVGRSLHEAILGGHKEIAEILLKSGADVNAPVIEDNTLADTSVQSGHKEVLRFNGVNIYTNSTILTPLYLAVKHNNKEIVKVLIANGANAKDIDSLLLAVIAGYKDIVDILLKNHADIDIENDEQVTLLHVAAQRGHGGIVTALIMRGADVNCALITNNATPLYFAAQEGHEDVVKVLIKNGANMNGVDVKSIPLHIAAECGYENIVEVLLNNGANVNIEDDQNRTAVEIAITYNYLEVVKMVLQYESIEAKIIEDLTVLHIAAREGNLEITNYLVDLGADLNAKTISGCKPIHLAAANGYRNIVEFFINNGLNINEIDIANQTLLHYCARKDQSDVAEYLIKQGLDVNIKDENGLTPLHVAASNGCLNVVQVLLKNGAIYNAVDKFDREPLGMASNQKIIKLLTINENLFKGVKENCSLDITNYIKLGAFVNSKNVDGITPLHQAARNGDDEIVDVLLQNHADPNATDDNGLTPLHYAVEASDVKMVKALLFNGAKYNAVSHNGKTPFDFAIDDEILKLFELISESFQIVKYNNFEDLNILNDLKEVDTVKAVMGARNVENKSLVVVAIEKNYQKVEKLKQIMQEDVSNHVLIAAFFLKGHDYETAMRIFLNVYEKRMNILGPNNPGTLDIQTHIATILYAQEFYSEALSMLEDISRKQEEILGLNVKDTLNTKSLLALVLHKQGRHEESLKIFQDVQKRQAKILGPHHLDTSTTNINMSSVLSSLGRFEEALIINQEAFNERSKILNSNHSEILELQDHIGHLLSKQHKYDAALEVFNEIYAKRKSDLGDNHSDTLRTLYNIAIILSCQGKLCEALQAHRDSLKIQENILGPNHTDTLNTKYRIAYVLFGQRKWIQSYKAYKEIFDQIKNKYGESHPAIGFILKKLNIFNLCFKLEGIADIEQYLQKDMHIAAKDGDVQTIQDLLKTGVDINETDADGRTPIHYAINNGHLEVVKILLDSGANSTRITNKGYTPLHTAAGKGCKEIAEVLLQHVGNELNNFINAKTVDGATSLHIAAENGFVDVVKSLLNYGARYNIPNKEGKTPLNLATDQDIIDLLGNIEQLFEGARNSNIDVIGKLGSLEYNDLVTVKNTRDNQGYTLEEVVISCSVKTHQRTQIYTFSNGLIQRK